MSDAMGFMLQQLQAAAACRPPSAPPSQIRYAKSLSMRLAKLVMVNQPIASEELARLAGCEVKQVWGCLKSRMYRGAILRNHAGQWLANSDEVVAERLRVEDAIRTLRMHGYRVTRT